MDHASSKKISKRRSKKRTSKKRTSKKVFQLWIKKLDILKEE